MEKGKGNITIKQLENGCFDVLYNEKRTGDLSFDEMLGLIAAITMPQKRPCLHWLKTEEWHEEEARRYKPKETEQGGMPKLLPHIKADNL
jgi:hypothetical protein